MMTRPAGTGSNCLILNVVVISGTRRQILFDQTYEVKNGAASPRPAPNPGGRLPNALIDTADSLGSAGLSR